MTAPVTVEDVRAAVVGEGVPISGPFGPRALVYADYMASGRALAFVEDAIRDHVLPFYGNTHTETSYTGRRTTRLRERARATVREAVGADDGHAVVFTGSGATAAADKLRRALRLDRRTATGPSETVIFVGPYEHHSNDLPWREADATLVRVPLDADGGVCLATLEAELVRRQDAPRKIGAFSAASNVTGVRTDLAAVARLLHAHGAVFVCDFAAAGPYVPIRLRESAPGAGDRIDAAFLSPHKFPGGPGASGVLVADRGLVGGPTPTTPGGGSVAYVTETRHVYLSDPERREEAGTPDIVGDIRAGMALALKRAVGEGEIERRDAALARRMEDALRAIPGLELLGPRGASRIGVFSFNLRVGARRLHHNFVVALLNDLFGVQARGGCSCAGPYGHALLGIGPERAQAHEDAVGRGLSAYRPGWARFGVNYFFEEATVDFIAEAVAFVARRGAHLLPLYRLDARAGVWRASGEAEAEAPQDLEGLWRASPNPALATPSRRACFEIAHRLADDALHRPVAAPPPLDAETEALRWFWLPHEAPEAGSAA